MAAGSWPSIPAMFFDWVGRRGDRPFLWGKHRGTWSPVTWAEAEGQVRTLARGLRALGVKPGDRVAMIMENRPEWELADLAIMSAGAITVPAYTTYTSEDYRHVLADSDATVLILGNAPGMAQRVLPAADQISHLSAIVSLDQLKGQTRADSFTWQQLMVRAAEVPDTTDATVAALQPDDTACLIYTSGTGGVPKGVMLTHRNMMSNAAGAQAVFEAAWDLGDEVFLSFLPLTHSYEHTAGVVFPLSLGAQTYFTAPETLAADMGEVRPTIMTAVPRLCETLQKRIVQAADRGGLLRRTLFRWAVGLGTRRYNRGGTLTKVESLVDGLLDRLVRAKVQQRFGGRLKAFVSGGAPLNRDVGLFFVALGVKLIQGYGQTESGPVVSVNPPNRIKVHTVGPPLAGVEVRIGEDGEVLVRGPNVMKGYWRDEETTARTIRDGWLHTGDIGELDGDGYLSITDRKRDFIKNSGGEMISPQRIEGFLTLQPGLAQAMVYGDRKPYVVALIVPDDETLSKHPEGNVAADPEVQQRIADAVAEANRVLTGAERVRRFLILDEAFTVANGMMTPTLKIKRHMIRQRYGEALERLYEGKG
ncbi:MAG TPA: long-chain fatty acid--CoA ligase [Stellaceae bacterium]|nr:long-chain fatty acid--CoA ligase [Stellaceae bacterium]